MKEDIIYENYAEAYSVAVERIRSSIPEGYGFALAAVDKDGKVHVVGAPDPQQTWKILLAAAAVMEYDIEGAVEQEVYH